MTGTQQWPHQLYRVDCNILTEYPNTEEDMGALFCHHCRANGGKVGASSRSVPTIMPSVARLPPAISPPPSLPRGLWPCPGGHLYNRQATNPPCNVGQKDATPSLLNTRSFRAHCSQVPASVRMTQGPFRGQQLKTAGASRHTDQISCEWYVYQWIDMCIQSTSP